MAGMTSREDPSTGAVEGAPLTLSAATPVMALERPSTLAYGESAQYAAWRLDPDSTVENVSTGGTFTYGVHEADGDRVKTVDIRPITGNVFPRMPNANLGEQKKSFADQVLVYATCKDGSGKRYSVQKSVTMLKKPLERIVKDQKIQVGNENNGYDPKFEYDNTKLITMDQTDCGPSLSNMTVSSAAR